MATIDDVAKRAGVSRSTVSLVLNKSPRVKEATRLMVEGIIAEMNYFPNQNARGLSARVTNNLGVIFMRDYLPNSTQISYDSDRHVGLCSANINHGIMAGLMDTEYGVVSEQFCSLADPDGLPRIIRERRVDGAFIVGLPYSDQFIGNMKASGIPFTVVGVGSYEDGVDSIYADPQEGVELMVQEMVDTGHRDICLMNSSRIVRSYEDRLRGYYRALRRNGMPVREDWNLSCASNSGRSAYEAFRQFWEAGNRPDAVVCANGQSASGVMSYLYEKNIRVPDDISIIAYEDSSLCGYSTPAMTAVNIRKEDLGYRAAQCLIARIRNPEKRVEINSVRPYIVRRDSVKNR